MAETDVAIDVASMVDALRRGDVPEPLLSRFLRYSWTSPSEFADSLFRAVATKRWGAKKAKSDAGYDLYHDCVTSHLEQGRTAFVAWSAEQTTQLSFDELDRRASALVGPWTLAGAKPGDSVAIVLPVGVDYAVALATALRVGLVVTTLPAYGATQVQRDLSDLEVDFVASAGASRGFLGGGGAKFLPVHPVGHSPAPGAFQFPPGGAVLRLPSPFGEPPEEPYEIDAERLSTTLARDALLMFGLLPGDRMAAPGLPPACLQPVLLLSAWFAGAAWVEVPEQEIERNPRRLDELGVTILGVSRPVRDRLVATGFEGARSLHSCFRLLNDVYDFEPWHRFARMALSSKVSFLAVLTNSASGGVHLFAQRTSEVTSTHVFPAPGRRWQLSLPVGQGIARNGSGVYTALVGPKGDADPSLPRVMIAESGKSWAFGGCMDIGPQGARVPLRSIELVAGSAQGVGAASAFVTRGRWANDARLVLLLFVDTPGVELGPLNYGVDVPSLRALMTKELGPWATPDVVEVLPLCPRFTGPLTDTQWCRRQYLSGSLTAKARQPLFRRLARLEWMFDTRGAPIAANE